MQFVRETWERTPPITRAIFFFSFGLSLAVTLDLVTPLKLYFNWKLITKNKEYWRLVTSLFYTGSLSPHTIFNFYLCFRYSYGLESTSFRNKPADFLIFIATGGAIFLFAANLYGL